MLSHGLWIPEQRGFAKGTRTTRCLISKRVNWKPCNGQPSKLQQSFACFSTSRKPKCAGKSRHVCKAKRCLFFKKKNVSQGHSLGSPPASPTSSASFASKILTSPAYQHHHQSLCIASPAVLASSPCFSRRVCILSGDPHEARCIWTLPKIRERFRRFVFNHGASQLDPLMNQTDYGPSYIQSLQNR